MELCPGKPNCVCSRDDRPRHAIAPLEFTTSAEIAAAAALRALKRLPRTQVTVLSGSPLHVRAACTTRIFRWVDDVELLLDPARSIIDVRSASRTGTSDFGVNRRRVETLRQLFAEELASSGDASPGVRG